MGESVKFAALGTAFTCLMTTLGAALVFFFRGKVSDSFNRISMGFASGVMGAASIWSLLLPGMASAKKQGMSPLFVAAGGFFLGAFCLILTDKWLAAHQAKQKSGPKDQTWRRLCMLVFTVTLHNIPEGMAVGLAFSAAVQAHEEGAFAAAFALALGMGIQNLPEGAAISLPMRRSGKGVWPSFLAGTLSGVVEPLFGVLAVLLSGCVIWLNPWLMAFAAGAMIYAVFQELLPEALAGRQKAPGLAGLLTGFLLMMALDVLLG